MTLQKECINCTVSIGGKNVSTPYIKSFSVNKQRGASSTASASLKMKGTQSSLSSVGGSMTISCNTNGLVFTGGIKKISISPCFEDPEYVIVNIEAEDSFEDLSGKKFTRRCRSQLSQWAFITGVSRKGLRDLNFARKKPETSETSGGRLDRTSEYVKNRTMLTGDMTDQPKSGKGYQRRDVQLTWSYVSVPPGTSAE